MATRAEYRTQLKNKLTGLDDEGYGDFEFTDTELDTYLELTVASLFPALYRKAVDSGLTLAEYNNGPYSSVECTAPERVFMVEDATSRSTTYGWQVRPTGIVGIDGAYCDGNSINVYFYDAFVLPTDDTTDAGIPAIWTPVVVLGALIEALESRHDTGQRPDQTQGHGEVSLLDRLTRRYETMVDRLRMNLPAVVV